MKKEVTEEYKKKSKELLKELSEKLFKTTMVAAISKLEEEFGELWGADGSSMDDAKLEFKKKFDAVRKHIFDTGHHQVDLLHEELQNYEVIWNRYVLKMPVKPRDEFPHADNCSLDKLIKKK